MCTLRGQVWRRFSRAIVWSASGALSSLCFAELSDADLRALSQDPLAVAAGKATYQSMCFSCHGQQLEGGTGFDLRDGEWKHGGNPSQILTSIRNGFPDKGMVAFGAVYDETTLNQLVAYILTEQIGFRGLSYRTYENPPTALKVSQVAKTRASKGGDLPMGYIDVSLAESERYAMVFEGALLVPKEGEHVLKVVQAKEPEIFVEIDGAVQTPRDGGNAELHYPVANGQRAIRLSYLKRNEKSKIQVFLQGETLLLPLSEVARKRMAATLFPVTVAERPVVVRKKIDNLPPKSIAVGYPGGLNYGYSPVTNSIVGLWQGEFLNIGPNIDGRGKDPSRIMGSWIFFDSPGIQLLANGEPVEGGFKKYAVGDRPTFEYGEKKRRVVVSAEPAGPSVMRFQFELSGLARQRIVLRIPEGITIESEDGAVLAGRLIVDRAKRSRFSITVSK